MNKYGTRNGMLYQYESRKDSGWLIIIPLVVMAFACLALSSCQGSEQQSWDMAKVGDYNA